jgi:lipopolysaccharide export system permease protein
MMKYFDDFVGKDLGFTVFAELMFYFSLNMMQIALPLGVLVSSLMTFGNLGERFELTAIKSAGISLTRALKPVFFAVIFLAIGLFFFSNYIVTATNLKAYSLLYDIKHKKPTLDIKPGTFYHGIPNYSIKAASKLPDNQTLLDVMIYDHTKRDGNKKVILSDSCKMYTIFNERFLKLELYDGTFYYEEDKANDDPSNFYRTSFDRLDMVFSLSSFDLKRTQEELFRHNRQMKNIGELTSDIDSLNGEKNDGIRGLKRNSITYMIHHFEDISKRATQVSDTVIEDTEEEGTIVSASFVPTFLAEQTPLISRVKKNIEDSTVSKPTAVVPKTGDFALDTMDLDDLNAYFNERTYRKTSIIQSALGKARNFKSNINGMRIRLDNLNKNIYKYEVSKYNKYSQAFACIVMFLIGAPLGAIIKKGGLGFPVIISIFFFITYYVLTMTSEKWAKAGFVEAKYAVWTADLTLLPIGLIFLRQARIDARLFETDFYLVIFDQLKARFNKKKAD